LAVGDGGVALSSASIGIRQTVGPTACADTGIADDSIRTAVIAGSADLIMGYLRRALHYERFRKKDSHLRCDIPSSFGQ
jgi:hypothetical protein